MAPCVAVVFSSINLLNLLLTSVAATTEGNYDSNSPVSNGPEVENFTTPQPEFTYPDPTTQSSMQPELATPDPVTQSSMQPELATPDPATQSSIQPSTTQEDPGQPALSAEPLPLSGRLLDPVTDVGMLCPCDEQRDLCDINCCCDRDCSGEVALFTGCSVHIVSGNQQLCSPVAAHYSLGSTVDGFSELLSSVQKETNYDVFCIQSHNRVEGVSYTSPALPTASNFDSLFKQFASYFLGSGKSSEMLSTAEKQTPSGYMFGDVMLTEGEDEATGILWLPAPGVTAYCVDMSPAVFLQDQRHVCSRRVDLDTDCRSLPALNMLTYTRIQLKAGKGEDAALVGVEVQSVLQRSLDGTQSEVKLGDGADLTPMLLSPGLCANVLLQVSFVVTYSPAGEIINVTASLLLGFVHGDALPLQQEFGITFVQEAGAEVAVHYSGNPGYVVGLPLVSGKRTAEGMTRSSDPRETLSLLHSEDQDCLHAHLTRSPVLFGLDAVSGCTFRLEEAANCSLLSQLLLDVLRGPNYPQYVAAFGSSPTHTPLDWVPINSSPSGGVQSCSIPLSLHFEIEWTKYGSLVNPQAQIVSVREVLHTNTSDLALLADSSSVLSLSSSVSFLSVSAPALPGSRAPPTIDAKLPFDFFFPFV